MTEHASEVRAVHRAVRRVVSTAGALLAGAAIGCVPASTAAPVTPAATPDPREYRTPPPGRDPARVILMDVVPEDVAFIPRWEAEHFGVPAAATTWRPADQPAPPLRWDRADPRDLGPRDRDATFVGYHGHGCCGGCQAVALLGALVAAARIEAGAPVPRSQARPHRPAIPALEDELDLVMVLATARHAYITGGRDVPDVAPSLALAGGATRAALRPLLGTDRTDWLPWRLCQRLAGRRLPVLRARVREHDVRFTTVALRDGPVVISGAFNRLRRDPDGISRCPPDARDLTRHHFMLVVGFELNDSDGDGEPDEVVWLVRDDHERRGGDDDTWEDAFLDDEWGRIVPRGCLLDGGRAHSIIPGTVSAGTFDDPVLPGPAGRVSFCEADPDGDGVPKMRDVCAYVPDPEQLDRDGDGVGDACDPCPLAPPASPFRPGHCDEDNDGLADACDPCPADPDPSCR